MESGQAQAEGRGDGAAPLSIRDLEVRLHQGEHVIHALRGVDFDVARGEIVALVGESGSGKSTLSLAVQGLVSAGARPEVEGSILVDGTEIVDAPGSTLRRVRRESVRSIFQDPMTSLNPTMRVGQQLAEAARDDRPPEAWLERVGIAQPARRVHAFPHELSGGERQRVMIAMAMSGKPVLVLADEPTTALDVTVQSQILELIRELRRDSGTAFVFVTHDLAVATTVADRIAVIYGGRIVESGAVEQVVARPAHPYSAALLEARFGLDADKSHQLPTLRGDPALATVLDDACAFAPRCLIARDECRATRPPLVPVSQHDGRAACLYSDQVTAELWSRTADAWSRMPAEAPEPIVVVENLRKTFTLRGRGRSGEVVALDDVNLTMRKGEAVAIVGESGSREVVAAQGDRGPGDRRLGQLHARQQGPAADGLPGRRRVAHAVDEDRRPGSRAPEAARPLARRSRSCASRTRSSASASRRRCRAGCRRSSRAVSSSERRSRARSSSRRISCSATSRSAAWTSRSPRRSSTCWASCGASSAWPCCSSRTTSPRPASSPTGCWSCSDGRLVEDGTSEQIVTAPDNAYTRELLASMPRAEVS